MRGFLEQQHLQGSLDIVFCLTKKNEGKDFSSREYTKKKKKKFVLGRKGRQRGEERPKEVGKR